MGGGGAATARRHGVGIYRARRRNKVGCRLLAGELKSGNGALATIRGPVTAKFLGLGRQGSVSRTADLAVHRYRKPRDRLPGFQALLGVRGAIQDKPDRIPVGRSRDGRGAVAVLGIQRVAQRARDAGVPIKRLKTLSGEIHFSEMIQNGHAKRQQPIGLPAWD